MSVEWKKLVEKAIQVGKDLPPTRFLQLATLTTDGLPSVRTVVFRGWYDDTTLQPSLKFTTDLRSGKVSGLSSSGSWAEACWYFVDSRDQFRFTGLLTVVGPEEDHDTPLAKERISQWQALSDTARLQFRFPPPGEARTDPDPSSPDPFEPSPPSAQEPENTFGLLILRPTVVDHYSTVTSQRQIYDAVLDDIGSVRAWETTSVNP